MSWTVRYDQAVPGTTTDWLAANAKTTTNIRADYAAISLDAYTYNLAIGTATNAELEAAYRAQTSARITELRAKADQLEAQRAKVLEELAELEEGGA